MTATRDRLTEIEQRLDSELSGGVYYALLGGYDDVDAEADVQWLIAEVKRLREQLALSAEVIEQLADANAVMARKIWK